MRAANRTKKEKWEDKLASPGGRVPSRSKKTALKRNRKKSLISAISKRTEKKSKGDPIRKRKRTTTRRILSHKEEGKGACRMKGRKKREKENHTLEGSEQRTLYLREKEEERCSRGGKKRKGGP